MDRAHSRATSCCWHQMKTCVHCVGLPLNHAFMPSAISASPYDYLLSLPRGFESEAQRRWPLLFFLHGAGERGPDMRLVAKHGPPKLLRADADLTEAESAAARVLTREFVVISP